MLKQKTLLEIKKEDRVYQLVCEPTAGLGELFDVISEMRGYVIERLKQGAQEEKSPEPPQE